MFRRCSEHAVAAHAILKLLYSPHLVLFFAFIHSLPQASAKQARAEGLREEKEGATLESRARAKQESRHPSLLLNQDQELLQELKLQEPLLLLKLQEVLLQELKLQRLLLRLKAQ